MAATKWFSHNGQEWHVTVGSEAHAQLLAAGAHEVADPTKAAAAKASSKAATA